MKFKFIGAPDQKTKEKCISKVVSCIKACEYIYLYDYVNRIKQQ